jgi:uncharacterized membrane protein YcaP (DUF421 family)
MKPEDIKIGDWQRVFVGDVPGAFYAEVLFRVFIIYLILMVAMRLMGKRMASQLSRNEMTAMVSLAAAIGVPLQSPDRGVLPILVIAAIVVTIQQLIAWLTARNQKLEKLTQGDIAVLVEDAMLNLDQMKRAGITRERVFAQLRCKSICHLGQVKRLYFEAGGKFTLIKETGQIPGLPILPIWDAAYQQQISYQSDTLSCKRCGRQSSGHKNETGCINCGSSEYISAVFTTD